MELLEGWNGEGDSRGVVFGRHTRELARAISEARRALFIVGELYSFWSLVELSSLSELFEPVRAFETTRASETAQASES